MFGYAFSDSIVLLTANLRVVHLHSGDSYHWKNHVRWERLLEANANLNVVFLRDHSSGESQAPSLQPPQSVADSSATRRQGPAADMPAAGLSPAEDDLRAVWLLAFRFVSVLASKAAAQWLSPMSLPVQFKPKLTHIPEYAAHVGIP